MKNYLLAFSFLALLAGCNKDKFQTAPQLTLLEAGNLEVPYGGALRLRLEFTDKEGDVDDTLFIRRVRINQRSTPTVRDSLKIKVPDFPDRNKGEIVLDLTYQNYLISSAAPLNVPNTNPPVKESDSLIYKFVLKDKAGNKSDTLVVNGIVVQRR
ncbi:hypothetical protein [Flaviaesturariibacter aridisoli]|uniref:DUF4625 domain-containing protein n=1 Tax=Flaviaesturariibacter aridisoli TaxID=2545761 RepID=A0A4R4E437_9BACT|nr:hypothetical protein [Flaviaesturariibacter aridisoli]RYY66086.1 MAG: hypothetical protein EOO12_05235 [Chitinophagaceae bacterium]TCZ71395.1 hypothetical protein E0486_09960 [Flaviaesturariibacter aridisoli]